MYFVWELGEDSFSVVVTDTPTSGYTSHVFCMGVGRRFIFRGGTRHLPWGNSHVLQRWISNL